MGAAEQQGSPALLQGAAQLRPPAESCTWARPAQPLAASCSDSSVGAAERLRDPELLQAAAKLRLPAESCPLAVGGSWGAVADAERLAWLELLLSAAEGCSPAQDGAVAGPDLARCAAERLPPA